MRVVCVDFNSIQQVTCCRRAGNTAAAIRRHFPAHTASLSKQTSQLIQVLATHVTTNPLIATFVLRVSIKLSTSNFSNPTFCIIHRSACLPSDRSIKIQLSLGFSLRTNGEDVALRFRLQGLRGRFGEQRVQAGAGGRLRVLRDPEERLGGEEPAGFRFRRVRRSEGRRGRRQGSG